MQNLSRRGALRLLLGSAASTALFGACGTPSQSGAPAELAFSNQDFAGARLSALMRSSFIDASNELTLDQAKTWAEAVNANLDVVLAEDWREQYALVASRRSGADLAELFGSSAHQYADRLVDVSDLAAELGAAQGGWMQAARDAVVVDGVWRAIPWAYTGHAINYREDILDSIGVAAPQTYDQLLEAATLLREAGGPMAAFSMSAAAPNDSANFAYSLLWSFGGQEVDKSGMKVALDSAGTRAALQYFIDLSSVSDPRALTFDEVGNNDAFLDGSVAMTQNAPSIYWKALNAAPDIAAAMNHVRYPSGPQGHHQLVEINSLAIFSHSRNIDAARDWIRFACAPPQLVTKTTVSSSFFMPSLLSYTEDPGMPWNTDPKLAGMLGTQEGGRLPGWPGPANIEADLVYQNGTIVEMFAKAGRKEQSIDDCVLIASEALRRVYET